MTTQLIQDALTTKGLLLLHYTTQEIRWDTLFENILDSKVVALLCSSKQQLNTIMNTISNVANVCVEVIGFVGMIPIDGNSKKDIDVVIRPDWIVTDEIPLLCQEGHSSFIGINRLDNFDSRRITDFTLDNTVSNHL